ncbi:MAG: hypothetical protein WDO73_11230 [Ignavibacteriota bacterium]
MTTKMMIAAVTLVAAAGVASAQTMQANVPFTFRANGQVFAAGSYRIQLQSTPTGNPLVLIHGNDSGKQVLSMSYRDGEAKEAWKSGRQRDALIPMRREPLHPDDYLDGLE